MKDLYPLITKPSLGTVGTMAKNKLNPLIGTVADMLENRDYYNTEIRNADDPYVQQLLDTAKYAGKQFEPFALRGLSKERERNASLIKQALPFVGITPAPAYVNNTPATELMDKLIQDKLPQGTRTKEQAEKSQTRAEAVRDLRSGKEDVDLSGFSPRQQRQIQRDSGKTALQVRFNRLGVEEAEKVFNLMNEKEKGQVQGIYDSKKERKEKEDKAILRPMKPERPKRDF
jgi:hypothetical protein